MLRVVPLESILLRAPLGVRFIDLSRGVPVTDGLVVTARPLEIVVGEVVSVGRPMLALRSPVSGIYGFRTLPGLEPYVRGEREASAWCGGGSPFEGFEPTPEELLELGTLRRLVGAEALTPAANFVVRVEDQAGRFLPQVLLLCLPREQLLEVPLFSSPARPVPSGLAAVRGQVAERDPSGQAGAAAGWALVTASTDGVTYAALADARGMFALFLPYAATLPPLAGSPPHGALPFDQLTWPISVQVFYEPAHQRRVPGLDPRDPPDVRSILEQRSARVYDTPTQPGSSVVRPLRLGRELVVATDQRSELLIDAA